MSLSSLSSSRRATLAMRSLRRQHDAASEYAYHSRNAAQPVSANSAYMASGDELGGLVSFCSAFLIQYIMPIVR